MRWTEELDQVAREVIPGRSLAEAIDLFEERTGIHLTKYQLANRRHVLGVHSKKTQPKRFWTPEREAYFREIVPGHEESEIRALFAERFGITLTEAQIGNAKTKFGIRSGTVGGRFQKGQLSWNKGKPWDEWMPEEGRAAVLANCFQKGNLPKRPDGWMKPVGYERVTKDGYIEVKVHDGLQELPNRNYRPKHHVIWEEHNGPIPPHTNIIFADGDKTNFDPENLVAVSRKDWAPIRHAGYPYADRETLETSVRIVQLSRAIREKEMERKEKEK